MVCSSACCTGIGQGKNNIIMTISTNEENGQTNTRKEGILAGTLQTIPPERRHKDLLYYQQRGK
jgi:hypothetical protein